MPRTRNSFASCMVQDLNMQNQNPNSYRHALNGRIRFNSNTDPNLSFEEKVKQGNTLAFVNDRGQEKIISLCPGYLIVQAKEMNNQLIIWSTNQINSEIGVLNITEAKPVPTAQYTTLYNDRLDPNGDKLGLSHLPQHSIEAQVSIEGVEVQRCYWVDGLNEYRAMNLALFYNKTTNLPHHNNQTCGATNSYPKHMSVHQMTANPDIIFGKMKYTQRIAGSLKTGAYELFYQLITEDGHHSMVRPVTKPITHHDSELQANNHHKTRMGASGTSTAYGFRFSVEGIDVRWSYIRVGYVYSTTDIISQEIVFFNRSPITGATMTFDLTKNGGQAVTKAYLNARTQWPLNPQTLGIFRQKMFVGGFKLPVEPQAQLQGFSIQPMYRLMDADETLFPNFTTENDTLTNSSPKTINVSIQNFAGNTDSYPINNDYANNKGTQWAHLFDGWWRGAPAELGLVVFDRKGNQLFVQPLPGYNTPQQYENANLTTVSEGRYKIRIMALNLSGITFRHQDLYDSNGKLNIGGFSIVRLRKANPIKFQGVVVPAVRGNDVFQRRNGGIWDNLLTDEEKKGKYLTQSTMSMPSYRNQFKANYDPDGKRYRSEPLTDISEPYSDYGCGNQYHEPYTFTLHAPDVMVNDLFPQIKETNRLKAVAGAHTSLVNSPAKEIPQNLAQVYTKNYKTGNIQGEVVLGSETRLSIGIYHSEFEKRYDKYDTDRKDEPNHYFHTITSAEVLQPSVFHAMALAPRTVIAKAKDWRHVDVSDPANNSYSSLLIVNFLEPEGLEEGSTNLTATEYDSIGHFQPITPAILAQTLITRDSAGNPLTYTFNGIELYGGGCYADFVDFTRLYPLWIQSGDVGYGLTHIVPLESNFRYAMRYGRRAAAQPTQAKSTLLDQNAKRFWNGIMRQQPEDWSLNRCLLNLRRINTYQPQPPNTTIRYELPTGILWSGNKIMNETDDTYRKLLPANIGDADGGLGEITGFAQLFNQMYILQRKGYGRALIDERAALANLDGENVYTGTAEGFTGVDPISSTHGMTYRNGVGYLKNSFYFMDVVQGVLNRHSQAGHRKVSDDYGRHDTFSEACKLISFFPNEVPRVVIQGDETQNEIYIHLDLPGSPYLTTVFNEDMNAFVGDYNIEPRAMAKLGRYLISVPKGAGKDIYLHDYGKRGKMHGTFYPTTLQFVGLGGEGTSYFDNMLLDINREGYPRIVAVRVGSINPHGQLHSITPPTDNRAKYLEGSFRMPLREKTHLKGPVLGKAVLVSLEILNNEQDVEVVLTSAEIDFRPSFKQ